MYDVLTKREMQNRKIDFYNATDLNKMVQDNSFAPVEEDNRPLVIETVRKVAMHEITYAQMNKILGDAGIDLQNAIAYFNESQISYAQQ